MSMAFSEAQNRQQMRKADGGARLFPRDALQLLPTAACVCDSAGRIVDCNDKAVAVWGRAPGVADTWETMAHGGGAGRQFQSGLERGARQSNVVVTLWPSAQTQVAVLANSEPVWEAGEHAGAIVTFHPCPDAVGDGARLWDMLDVLPAAIYICDPEGRISYFNKAAADLWGTVPEIGSSLWCGAWKLYRPDGSPLPIDQTPMATAVRERRPIRGEELILERPDGSRIAIQPHPTPLYDAAGAFVGAVNMLVDVTHQKVAEERHVLFARELNHRVKNALATVYAIAMQTLRYTDSLEDFRESFSSRLLALSRAHDLLVRCQWQETPLRTILAESLSSFGSARLRVDGDEADFGPRATLTLAMTFHELVTNAMRFGALSNPDGIVSVSWKLERDEDGERQVSLSWSETGGPAIEDPIETGFGARLINHNLMALGGSFQPEFEPEGFRCRMTFPVINEAPGWPPGQGASPSAPGPSGGQADPASPGGRVH
ncbi:MAG: HWE histidine kinase domain-containing protein [Sphingomonadales bacterium]